MAAVAGGIDEANGLADSFVRTFGVVDIVLGALGLYGVDITASAGAPRAAATRTRRRHTRRAVT
jgi:hypothetical protein